MDISALQILFQRYDPDTGIFLYLQHLFVPGYDTIRMTGHGTFKHAIIGLISKELDTLGRFDNGAEVCKENSRATENFLTTVELGSKDRKDIIHEGAGEDKDIITVDDPLDRRRGSVAGEDQGGNQDIGTEDDPHRPASLCRSFSDKTPFSLALRLQ